MGRLEHRPGGHDHVPGVHLAGPRQDILPDAHFGLLDPDSLPLQARPLVHHDRVAAGRQGSTRHDHGRLARTQGPSRGLPRED